MIIQSNYYFRTKKRINEEVLFTVLKKSKLSLIPIFESYQSDFNSKIKKFGFSSSKGKILEQPYWTIITNGKDIFIFFKYVEHGFELNITTDNEQKAEKICQIILKLKNVISRQKGYEADEELMSSLKKKLGKQGPNGKIINDKKLNSVFLKITSSDQLRLLIKKIADTYNNLPVPLEQIQKLNVNTSELNELILDSKLITKSYKIICESCKQPSEFLFQKREDATNSLKKAKFYCPKCSHTKTCIDEYFCLTDKAIRIIKGIWLEKLCAEEIGKITNNYLAGYMSDQNELDGITVFSRKIVLIECKDTTFGQSDLYIVLAKADDIDAKQILIVTTCLVHDNVKKLIEKYEKQGKREIKIIDGNKVDGIKEELIKKFRVNRITDIIKLADYLKYSRHRSLTFGKNTFITTDLNES